MKTYMIFTDFKWDVIPIAKRKNKYSFGDVLKDNFVHDFSRLNAFIVKQCTKGFL